MTTNRVMISELAKLLEQAVERLVAVEKKLADKVLQYRGVWKSSDAYSEGNFVTHGGSLFHCNREVAGEQPGQSDAWTLAVKRGRDGKDNR